MEHIFKYQDTVNEKVANMLKEQGFKTVNDYYKSLGLTGYSSKDKPWLTEETKELILDDIVEINEYDYYKQLNPDLSEEYYRYYGKWFTREEDKQLTEQVIKGLQKLGLTPNTKVGISMLATPESFYLVQALQHFEVEKIILNPTVDDDILREQLNLSKPDILMTADAFLPEYNRVIRKNEFDHIFNYSVAESMTPLYKMGFALQERKSIARTKEQLNRLKCFKGNVWDIGKLKQYGKTEEGIDSITHKPSRIILNGSSTGTTTGHPTRHRFVSKEINGIIQQHIAEDLVKTQKLKRLDMYVHTLPLVVPLAYTSGTNLFSHMGVTFYLDPEHHEDNYARQLIEATKYGRKIDKRVFGMSDPATLNVICKRGQLQNANLANLNFITLGGEPASKNVELDANEYLRERGMLLGISKGYGQTNKGGVLSFGGTGIICGQGKPLPLNNVQIRDMANPSKELPYYQIGYIYAENPLQPNPDNPNTEDLGYMDETGEIFAMGREKDSIVSQDGKYKAYAADMNALVELNNAVRAAKVVIAEIEVETEVYENKFAIFIELRDEYLGQEEKIRQEIYDNLTKAYPTFAQPDGILVEDLKISKVGKYDMRGMKKDYENYVKTKKMK